MHRTEYDVNRILIWISSPQADKPFTRDTIINQLAPISFGLIDYVLNREVKRGSIYKSGPTGTYYMRKDSNMMSDIDKRLSDLEVKYKWLEGVVAETNLHIDKLLYDKPEPKQRLWKRCEYLPNLKMGLDVDVMLADGEVLINVPCSRVAWKNYPNNPGNAVAWRKAEQ